MKNNERDEVVQIKNLSFSYQDNKVLQNIDLEINSGEFLAFVGPNGSGKSTLMKLIIGELEPDQGQINILGQPVAEFADWPRIGYISQEVKSFNHSFPATAQEIIGANLYSKLGVFKIITGKLEAEIDRALELVDMKDFKSRQLGNMSGGQQQRIFIARTLVNDPEIIFLDEPLVGVDGTAQDSFFRLINRLNRELNITIVMISHDVHVISSEANRVVCFSDTEIFVHEEDNFDYQSYQSEINRENRLIPEHEHQDGE